MALAQRLIDPPGQHPEEPIGEPATPVSQADPGALSAGKGAAGLVNPSEEPHETRGTYGRSAAPSNSAPCRPPCHAPGCTLGIWYGSGDWTAWPRLSSYLSRSW